MKRSLTSALSSSMAPFSLQAFSPGFLTFDVIDGLCDLIIDRREKILNDILEWGGLGKISNLPDSKLGRGWGTLISSVTL